MLGRLFAFHQPCFPLKSLFVFEYQLFEQAPHLFYLESLTASIAQTSQNSAILRFPKDANGFLILNSELNPLITQWEISITKPDASRIGGTTTIYQKILANSSFDFINPRFQAIDGTLTINGLDMNGDIIYTESNSIGPNPPPIYNCEWMCIGSDYVYGIHSLTSIGGTRLKIVFPPTEPANQPTNGFDRYYEWFAESDFLPLNQPNGLIYPVARYALAPNLSLSNTSTNIIDQRIIRYTTGVSEYFQNRFGDPITGNLIGVQKYLGPYYQGGTSCYSNPLLDDGCSSLLVDGAIDLINQNATNPVLIECNGFSSSGPSDPTFDVDDCVEEFYETLGTSATTNNGGTNWTVFTVQQLFAVPCIFANDVELAIGGGSNGNNGNGVGVGGNTNTGSPFVWPNVVNNISLTNLSNVSNSAINLSKATFFDETGNFLNPSVTIPEGFYLISYQLQGGKHATAYTYNPRTQSSGFSQSNFVTYGAYPVPMTHNWFKLNVEATQRVEFTFEMRTINGELKYSENFVVEKDGMLNKKITPNGGIQSGVYTNLLKFKDGSQISFQTIK